MNAVSGLFYFSIIGAALMLSVLGVWLTAVMPGLDGWSKPFFRDYFIAFILICLSCLVEMVLWYYPVPSETIYFIQVLECVFLSIPLPMLTVYLLHCCGEAIHRARLFYIVLSLETIYLFLLASALFIGGFTYIVQDNQYYRGPLYPLLLLPLIAILLFNFAGLVRRRKRLSQKVFFGFRIAILPMTAALLVHLFVDAYPLIDISYVTSALVMYGFILSDQIEQDLRQQREIAHQRASILVLQMRPHFIYNTMTSIYSLCNQDAQKARQVTLDFTTYLRKNFTAVASATPIPFTAELEHTRAYLAVEQAQYEDSLFVDYDTPHTWFRVPPLTLQPIVENAVKHGRNPYAGALHISIRTRRTDSGAEITVADDGRGFRPAGDGEGHTALKNIRQRLELMCGGSLMITPNEGGGTVVTVTIPDRAAHNVPPAETERPHSEKGVDILEPLLKDGRKP